MRLITALLVLMCTTIACSVPESVKRLGDVAPTPHERYARSIRDAGLAETALGREWLAAADTCLRAAHVVSLPFREAGYYDRSEARAVAWRFPLTEGTRVTVSLSHDGLAAQLFLDLFEHTADSTGALKHRAFGTDSTLAYEVRESGTYVLRMQPELLRSGRYEITIQIAPVLAFPVSGRDNSAIQSFYGADRDGGQREHQGIDIFAPRGTPVLAATDGTIGSTSPNTLGGNVVWLYDLDRGQTLYYAHLDKHVVTPGQRVHVGDTIGFVGNTGNARTTNPHLHFGIYKRGRGAINPLSYVKRVTMAPSKLRADTTQLGTHAHVRTSNTSVRESPAQDAPSVRRVSRDESLWIVGATGSWFRVQLDDGTAGYVPSAAIR